MKKSNSRLYPIYQSKNPRSGPKGEKRYFLISKEANQADSFVERNHIEAKKCQFVESFEDLLHISNVTVIIFDGSQARKDYPELRKMLMICLFHNVKIISSQEFIASLN